MTTDQSTVGAEELGAAARGAKLPNSYQWGRDAMEAFDFGKERAAQAVEALAMARRASPVAGDLREEATALLDKLWAQISEDDRVRRAWNVSVKVTTDDLRHLRRVIGLSPPSTPAQAVEADNRMSFGETLSILLLETELIAAQVTAATHGISFEDKERASANLRMALTALGDACSIVRNSGLSPLATPPATPPATTPSAGEALPCDVVGLVIAARKVQDEEASPESLRNLDAAAEAFASRVPWENEP